MKKMISFILILTMVLSMGVVAYADTTEEPTQSRAVIGADLTEEQVAAVYNLFGVKRGDVVELKVTNARSGNILRAM